MIRKTSQIRINPWPWGVAAMGVGVMVICGGCKSTGSLPTGKHQASSVQPPDPGSTPAVNRLVDFSEVIESDTAAASPDPSQHEFGATAGDQPRPAAKTEDHYVSLALAAHPRIRAARGRVAAAINRVPQQRALPDPMFSNTFWPIHDQAIQTAAGRVGNQMSLSQSVPWPKKLQAKAAAASKEIQVAIAEVETIERQVAESVRLAYYELWFATRAIQIVNENRDLAQDLVRVAEGRYRSGGRQSDVTRAQLEVDKLDEQVLKLASQKAVAQADLATLLHQPVGFVPEAAPELKAALAGDTLDDLITQAEACNPALRGLAWQIQRDRAKRQVACLEKYPDLQVGIGWGLVSDDDALSPISNGHDTIGFTVGVTLPIWKDKINAGIREADANTGSSIQLHQATRDEVFGTVRRLFAEAQSISEQLRLYEERIIPRTERAFKFALADYRGMRAEFFDVIDIYQELLMHQLQITRIRSTLAGKIAQIQRAAGCGIMAASAAND